MPTSITRLSKFTIPIAGLNPQGVGQPSHNMISPGAGGRGKRGKIEGRTYTRREGEGGKGEGETKRWKMERKRLEISTTRWWMESKTRD